MDRGIGHWVTKRAFLNGRRTAFLSGDASFTYDDLERRTNQVASSLLGLGVRKGDRVAVLLMNSVEFMEVLLSCSKLGAITVPINVRLAGPEIGFILADAGADVLVFHEPLAAAAVAALAEPGVRVRRVVRVGNGVADGELAYTELLSGDGATPLDIDVAGGDPAFIMYTSGTTGRPKGAILTH
ncbi:MAG: AMP-binding protein, partial [Actinobacteria bacterium]|nr:AMP-binding protein [Actinomycetota bacterium]